MKVRRVATIPVKGRHVSPEAVRDMDGSHLRRPALDLWLAARLLSGMTPKALVVASGSAMSVRTAYRWKRDLVALEEVEIAGYRAIFAVRRYSGPARLTPWEKAA